MKTLKFSLIGVSLAALIFTGVALSDQEREDPMDPLSRVHETNPNAHNGAVTAGSTGQMTPAITYHNGPVMSTPNVYLIWYGNWNQTNGSDTSTGKSLVTTFLTAVSGSPYLNINKTYNNVPSGNILIGGSITDAYSQTARLTDAKVQAVVTRAMASTTAGHLPVDPNGIYFVLTSTDVSESSGFCTKYCGWHTSGTISGSNIKYSFVGNANRCVSGCAAQTISPNNNAGVEGMISVIAHELEETITDPNPRTGWADSNGAENADKCAWTFGSALSTAPNGSKYNMTLGGLNFLIQRNLSAANSKCYVALNGAQ